MKISNDHDFENLTRHKCYLNTELLHYMYPHNVGKNKRLLSYFEIVNITTQSSLGFQNFKSRLFDDNESTM